MSNNGDEQKTLFLCKESQRDFLFCRSGSIHWVAAELQLVVRRLL